MSTNSVGLTKTYNALKDPICADDEISNLRALHEALDRAVLDAYGWQDIEIPPFCPMTPEDEQALERFNDLVIDRLYVLNTERAQEEQLAGVGRSASKKKASARSKRSNPQQSQLSLDNDGD